MAIIREDSMSSLSTADRIGTGITPRTNMILKIHI